MVLLGVAGRATTQQTVDPNEILKNMSLFAEYHKNGDFQSAIPFGWTVYKLDPKRFKPLYQRLAECYFGLYEKAPAAEKRAYADSMLIVYDLGIEHVPDRAPGYWLSKAYALENYYEDRELDAIAAYEKALELDYKGTDFAYVDRLGLLYLRHVEENVEFKEKALNLYQRVVNEDPANQAAADRLKGLVSDPRELVALYEKLLANDPENIEYIWGAARASIQSEQYAVAERYLQRLIKKDGKNATYWNELAKVQQRQRKFRDAIDSYEKALSFNAALKENFLNISICYREMKNYPQARTYAQRAAASERGWGRPYIEIAEIYKVAVEDCIVNSKGGDWSKLDINDKLVYRLAQESYSRARQVEPGIANEADRLSRDLTTLVPAREDYFFHRSRVQNGKMAIQSPCYEWIKDEVTVPTL
jgi:tetratricopeptide (TPR) repeat protein